MKGRHWPPFSFSNSPKRKLLTYMRLITNKTLVEEKKHLKAHGLSNTLTKK